MLIYFGTTIFPIYYDEFTVFYLGFLYEILFRYTFSALGLTTCNMFQSNVILSTINIPTGLKK